MYTKPNELQCKRYCYVLIKVDVRIPMSHEDMSSSLVGQLEQVLVSLASALL